MLGKIRMNSVADFKNIEVSYRSFFCYECNVVRYTECACAGHDSGISQMRIQQLCSTLILQLHKFPAQLYSKNACEKKKKRSFWRLYSFDTRDHFIGVKKRALDFRSKSLSFFVCFLFLVRLKAKRLCVMQKNYYSFTKNSTVFAFFYS